MGFKVHNQEVKRVWDGFWGGNPSRVPMVVGISERFFMFNPETNPKGVSFYDYSNDPELMFQMQLQFEKYKKFHIVGDHEMGIPEEGWSVSVDLQNYYEVGWLGGEVVFKHAQVPYAVPLLGEDNKEALFYKGIPDPFGGLMGKAKEYYEYFMKRKNQVLLEGQKITNIGAPFLGTDGVFTIACELRGAENVCIDIYEDPEYYHQLMAYLTEATIQRLKAWRQYMGVPEKTAGFGFADDSIALLSTEMYQEFVLPYHKKIARELSSLEERGFVHLCGDATRHFKTIRDELNIYTFDTGFPVNHRELALELGPEVIIQGGPEVQLIKSGSEQAIHQRSQEILESVKGVTKRFIFRDGNDIAPYTPLKSIEILYEACKKYGQYT